MTGFELTSHSPQETQDFGRRVGGMAQPGDTFLLVGDLGAGKTCLTQGIAFGLGIKEYTLSPTFVLVREYQGRLPLYHIDLYRLDRLEEIADLCLDEYLYGEGVCVIEWAEKGLSLLPGEHMLVRIAFVSETERRFSVNPSGKRYKQLVDEINKNLH